MRIARFRLSIGHLAVLAALTLLLLGGAAPVVASFEGAWLDQAQPANWNAPGQPLPQAKPSEVPIDPRAAARERSPETAEDQALVNAGWRLFAPYQAGWGVKLIQAGSSYDGMGRPWDYQVFVFVDGAFAGTLSPEPMDSRTDGALDRAAFFGEMINAEFRRYADSDPLCCPTGSSTVSYRIERGAQGPLVVPVSAVTSWQQTEAAPVTPAPAAQERYTVQPGDWLAAIAANLYGNSGAWPRLYEANREAIGPNPNLLSVGLVLVVPR